MSSLKSPSIRVSKLAVETRASSVDSMVVKACNGTVGDRYSTKMFMLFPLGNVKVLQATSMPLDVKEHV
jgi:hypothetical protein